MLNKLDSLFWTLVWHKWHLKGPSCVIFWILRVFKDLESYSKTMTCSWTFSRVLMVDCGPRYEFSYQKTLTFQFVNWIFDKLALLMDLDLGLVTPGDLGPEGLAWIGTSVARVLCRAAHHVGLKWINHRSLMLKLFWHDLFPTLCQNWTGLNRSKSQSWMIISQNRK